MIFSARLNVKPHYNVIVASSVSLMLLSSTHSYAIEAYQATYSASLKSTVNISGTLKRSLRKSHNNQWLFEDDISAFLATIKESSLLSVSDNKITPHKYHYLRKVIGKKKKNDISFDWTKKQAISRDQSVMPLKSNTQDPLSYQLQLQLDLQKGKRGRFSYPYTKKNRIEELNFVEVGTEVIDTPFGKLESIKLKLERKNNAKRETFIWFSIENNFIISQLKQTEADGKSYSIQLEKLTQ